MQGRLLHLIARRLHSSTSRLSSLRRFSSSSEEALTENLSIFNRERPTQRIKQPKSHKQNPSESGPNSESHPNPNSNPLPDANPQCNPNLDHNPSPNIFPNPRIDSNANPNSDASLPEVQKCIWAVERLSKGKRYTVLDRRRERIPAYVCEQDSPDVKHVLILLDSFQIQSLWDLLGRERFLCTIFTLEVFDGFGSDNVLYRQRVLPRRINFDRSIPGKITNVGFIKAPPGMKLRLDVPIRICGQEDCTGLKKGGFLQVHLLYASIFCLPEELPPYLEVHVNDMDIGDKICLGDLRIGAPLSQASLPICEIV